MALYRNIGFVFPTSGSGITTSSFTPLPGADAITQSTTDYWTQQNQRYDHALSTDLAQLWTEGVFVTTDDGTLFQTPNAVPYTGGIAPDFSKAWLPIQDIQQIENGRGTPGALLLHLQQPALAKNYAGYDSGSSATFTGGADPVVQPPPEIQALPPVTLAPDGTTVFTQPAGSVPTTVTPTGTTTSTPTDSAVPVVTSDVTPTVNKSPDYTALVALAGAMVIALTDDFLVHTHRKLVFAGGVGLLYYLLNRQQTQTT